MPMRRPFAKTNRRADDTGDTGAQRVRFRHRFDRDDVIDVTVAREAESRPLDRTARRAARVAQVGYAICLAAVSAPRTPTWSQAV